LSRTLFRAAILAERHVISSYFFDLQTAELFGVDRTYRGISLDDPIDFDGPSSMLYATPQQPELDVRSEVEAIALFLQTAFDINPVRQVLPDESGVIGLRFNTPQSNATIRVG
jgi:hypothetical protein